MTEKILFLDLSTTTTGYALFKNGEYKVSGIITEKSENPIQRIYQMTEQVFHLYKRYTPSKIILEKLPYTDFQGHETSTYLHGAIHLLAYQKDILLEEGSLPTHWRKVLNFDQSKNKTKSVKEQSLEYAGEITQKTITNDNEADAICLGTAYFIENERNEINSL